MKRLISLLAVWMLLLCIPAAAQPKCVQEFFRYGGRVVDGRHSWAMNDLDTCREIWNFFSQYFR